MPRLTTETMALLGLAILSVSVTSCTNSGQPKALDVLYGRYEANRVAYYQSKMPEKGPIKAETEASRNDVMNDLILMIDHNYGKIEASLYGHKSWADFAGSVLTTGLSTAGTLTGNAGNKTTLSALVTAINSTKTSFDKDILQGQTMIAIVAKMRALRADKLVAIRQSMGKGTGEYPLSQGLDDLMEYYQAGTFIGALQSVTEHASADKVKAQDALNSVKKIQSVEDLLKEKSG